MLMQRLGWIVAFVLAALWIVGATTARQDSTAIRVVERADNDVVTDLGEEGDSVGDILTFANAVYDEANETQVGTDNGYCIRTAVGVAWECVWTLTLADGQLTVEGPFMDSGDSLLAITGGTGAYANAGGEMKLHARNDEGTEYDFTYSLIANAGA